MQNAPDVRTIRTGSNVPNDPNVPNVPNDPNDPNDWIYLNRLAEFKFGIFLERVAHHPVGLEDEHLALLTISCLHDA